MSFNRFGLYAAIALGGLVFTTPASACRLIGATGIKDQTVDMPMSVQNGKNCLFRHTTSANDAIGNRTYPSTNLSITSRPSKGSVSIEGSRITYKAQVGYTGSDQFVYRSYNKRGDAFNYRVNVSVY